MDSDRRNSLAAPGTFSKSPSFWGLPGDIYAVDGEGSTITLTNGRRYIDYVCGLGTNLIGYNNPNFVEYMECNLHQGFGFSLPHYLEKQVADLLVEKVATRIPGFDKDNVSIRFAKTGSDATTMAVRLARAVTNRDFLFHHGYSGWGADFIAKTPPGHGIIPLHKHHVVDLPDLDNAQETVFFEHRGWKNAAAVMFECGIDDPPPNRFSDIRALCSSTGSLMIVDEVVTGLRYGVGGACERYGIEPDIVVMGKALGNGLPISAIIARKEYMDWFKRNDPVFCSSTHWGENLSLAAAKYVLAKWNDTHVKNIWHKGASFVDGMRTTGWQIEGHPVRSVMKFNDEYERAWFIQGMYSHRILMNRPNFICLAHTYNQIRDTIDIARKLKFQFEKFKENPHWKKVLEPYLPKVLFSNR
jgi:glutamate-1-semialdehyde aminotransferase